jgi:hypothetical protein
VAETPGTDGLMEEFEALGTAHRSADGTWTEDMRAVAA